jgi:phenylpropionate dioxygenase-like ring-hydroxylating dioxygenase large terminal subunit
MSLIQADGDLINHWYIIALDSEVPLDKPIKRWLYEKPYVLFRNTQGQVQVLLDKCIHRAAQLSLGKVCDGKIKCPYHGWTFDGSGLLIDVPSDGNVEGSKSNEKGWRVNSLPVVVQDGCVWVWPGDPAKKTVNPEWRFQHFGNSSVAQYFMITDFDNEVTHLVQNFMDVPHTVFVHAKWFRNRSLLKVPVEVNVGSSRVKVIYHQKNDTIGFTGKILNPNNEPMLHTDEFIFPNITRVDYNFGNRFFIINSQCTPIERHKTRVYTWIAYDIGMLSHLLKPFMKFYTRKVIQQDVEIMENQGQNLKVFTEADFKSTQADELHVAIDRMRMMGAQDKEQTKTLNYTREREFWI